VHAGEVDERVPVQADVRRADPRLADLQKARKVLGWSKRCQLAHAFL
jgi:hypothetical protein